MTTDDTTPEAEAKEEVFIVNDVLAFIQCKTDTITKEQLVDILQSFYKLDSITEARDVLYRDPPPSLPGRLKRRSNKRDILEDMYDVVQLFAVHAADRVFVCRDLNNVPPVTMKSIDPVMLYKQTVDSRAEIQAIKTQHEEQLSTIMDAIYQLRADLSNLAPSAGGRNVSAGLQASNGSQVPEAVNTDAATPYKDSLLTGAKSKGPASSATVSQAMNTVAPLPSSTSSTSSSTTTTVTTSGSNASPASAPTAPGRLSTATGTTRVQSSTGATQGLRQPPSTASSTHSYFDPSAPPSGAARKKGYVRDEEGWWHREKPDRHREPPQQRPKSTIGTGTRKKLRVVTVARHDIFVTRLHPDTTVEDIIESVRDFIGDVPVTVTKLRTRHDSYASFRVSCQQLQHYQALLDPDAWDAGSLVRPYVPMTERPPPTLNDHATAVSE